MNIRPAKKGDARAIAEIWNGIIADPFITFTTQEKTPLDIEKLIEKQIFLALFEGDILQGFATCGPFRSGPGYRHTAEVTIHLAPDARGRGGGRALMQALLKKARKAGAHVMVAAVSGQNHAAVSFHHAMGFDIVAQMPEVGKKAGRWLDLVLLQKQLN